MNILAALSAAIIIAVALPDPDLAHTQVSGLSSPASVKQQEIKHRTIDTVPLVADTLLPPLLGANLRYGVDTTVSPCADFYLYVNGDWRRRTSFANDTLKVHTFRQFFSDTYERTELRLQRLLDSIRSVRSTTPDAMLQALGFFYESCLTTDSLERAIRRVPTNPSQRDSTRAQQCRQRVIQYMGGALGNAFAGDLFAGDVLPRMQAVISSIHTAVKNQIRINPWMTMGEKQIALGRLEKLNLRVGMPKQAVDYRNLTLLPDQYHANKVAITNFKSQKWLTAIGGDVSDRWQMGLLEPNALYESGTHSIEIPAVMFMPPFFNVAYDDALNFAAIGLVVGHEIFHSVAGQLPTVENPAMAVNIRRLKDMYTAMAPLDGWKPNGDRTFSEDVADLGGVRVAYNAWKTAFNATRKSKPILVDGFTPEQRFFVAMARTWRAKWRPEAAANGDVHSPPFARVNGMVMNMPEFAKAFGCKAGDPMMSVADKQAVIW